jgi:hypothetical protein
MITKVGALPRWWRAKAAAIVSSSRAFSRELDEAQPGRRAHARGIERQRVRIADDGRVEIWVPHARRMGIDPVPAGQVDPLEQGEAAGGVGVKQDRQQVEHPEYDRRRAEYGQPGAPLRRLFDGVRTGNR